MRIIDLGAVTRENGRFVKTYTLTYEATLPAGETVKFVRKLPASGIERMGAKLTCLPFDDDRIGNIAVVDTAGEDITFDFKCFQGDPPAGSPTQQELAFRLLTFIPPNAA